MPFKVSPIQPLRPVAPDCRQSVAVTAAATPTPSVSPAPVKITADLSAGPEPFDAERVAAIRKALENGTYPIVPARIADAVIAAGLFLGIHK